MTKKAKKLPEGFADPWLLAQLSPDTPLAVAFSGGADSVALLSMLADRDNLHAVHVHHGIRGEEADRDAEFCRRTAEALSVPFTLLCADVPALAKERGESVETAARHIRYELIADWMQRERIPLLVTAHHADDQLETMLQHLLRGSGTRGLGGIPACRSLGNGLWVARPLLKLTKNTLLRYVKENKLSFVTDSTNNDLCYQRNFLRHRVLPLLEELQPGAAAVAARAAASIAEDECYLDSLAVEFLDREGKEPAVAALRALPAPIFARVMRRLLPAPPETVHIAALRELLDNPKPYAALSLPRARVLIEKGRLRMSATVQHEEAADYEFPVLLGESRSPDGNVLILLRNSERSAVADISSYKYTAEVQLDAAIIKGKLLARCRRPGDKILCGGMHKAVRRLRELSHLTPEVRARMPLLADDEGIVAVPFGPKRDGGKQKNMTVIFCFN